MTPYESHLLEMVLRRYLSNAFTKRVVRDVNEAFARASETNLRDTVRPAESGISPQYPRTESDSLSLRETSEFSENEG